MDSDTNSNSTRSETVDCTPVADETLYAIGGGALILGVGQDSRAPSGVALISSHPTALPGELAQAWAANAQEVVATDENWVLRVYVICANVEG